MSHYVTCSNFCRSLGLLQLYKTLFRKKTKLSEKPIIIPLQTMIHKEDIKVTKTSYRQSKKKVKENIMIIVSELVLKTLKNLQGHKSDYFLKI